MRGATVSWRELAQGADGDAETSDNTPLKVDYLPDTGLKGTLGITALPGRKSVMTTGAFSDDKVYARSTVADLERLREELHTTLLVTLVESFEFTMTGTETLLPRASQDARMASRWFPVRDHDVPDSIETWDALVRQVVEEMRRGGNVVVHCRAGKGRAPMLAACVLVKLGAGSREAVEVVQAHRPGALQNLRQQDYVGRYGRWLEGAPGV